MDPCSRQSLRLVEMDVMIAHEVVRERYLKAIEHRGLAQPFRRQRHLLWRTMDDIVVGCLKEYRDSGGTITRPDPARAAQQSG